MTNAKLILRNLPKIQAERDARAEQRGEVADDRIEVSRGVGGYYVALSYLEASRLMVMAGLDRQSIDCGEVDAVWMRDGVRAAAFGDTLLIRS
jgi:hypothetical protein